MEDRVVQGEVCVHPLELGVFLLELLEAPQLVHFEPRVFALPLVERGSRNVQAPADLVRGHARLEFIDALDDFRFGTGRFLMAVPLPSLPAF